MKHTDPEFVNRVIRMAWRDCVSFERIRETTGLGESEVITLMRRELKPSSFRLWRKRVSGRSTKHRKRFLSERACGKFSGRCH